MVPKTAKHEMEEYEIEGAVNTLTKAEQIKHDPAMMEHVKKSMQEHMTAMQAAMKGMGGMKKGMKGMDGKGEKKKYGSYVYA